MLVTFTVLQETRNIGVQSSHVFKTVSLTKMPGGAGQPKNNECLRSLRKDEVKKTTVCRCKSPYQRQSHKLFNSISAYEKSNLLDLLTFTESTEFNVAELFCSSNLGMYVWLDLVYFR